MEACEPAFENRFTRAFGFPVEKIRTKSRDFLLPTIKAFISESPFLVMATCDPDGRCDASPKGGLPGFVRILDDRHLLVPDVAGNKLVEFRSKFEDALNPVLVAATAGCCIGGGSGLRYAYIDLALTNLKQAVPLIRQILAEHQAPLRSWLLFHDDDLAAEWIGIYEQTPPPPEASEE